MSGYNNYMAIIHSGSSLRCEDYNIQFLPDIGIDRVILAGPRCGVVDGLSIRLQPGT